MKQTVIQLLKESIDYEMKLGTKMVVNWERYLEMEKEQIERAYNQGVVNEVSIYYTPEAEQYYKQTYK
jgi:hypothetical protein